MIITIKARTRKYLGSKETIERVQNLLRELARDFLSRTLVEEVDEDDQREGAKIDLSVAGSLAKHIETELLRSAENRERLKALMKDSMPDQLPFERQLGSVHFESMDRSKEIHLFFDEYELAPNINELQFGNHLSIKSDEDDHQGEKMKWANLSVLSRVFDNDLFDHGFCCVSGQYDAKNLERSDGGICAVGLDASKYLPGFYWGNYFGDYLCEFVGKSKLLDIPGCCSMPLKCGILVTNKLPPNSWSESDFRRNENLAMDHIGRQLFFEKGKEVSERLF